MSEDGGDAATAPFDPGDSADAIAGALREGIGAADVEELDAGDREELGRELGARVGREFGAALGRSVGELLVARLRDGESESDVDVLTEIRTAVVDLLRSLLTSPDVRSALGDAREYLTSADPGELADGASEAATDVTDAASSGAEEVADEVSDAAGEVMPGEESTSEEEGEASEEEGEASEGEAEASEGETEAAEDDAEAEGDAEAEEAGVEADVSPEEFGELREETLRELLDVMSYDDLQSVAKKVDVKGNLGRDEMTDQIIGTFADGESGDDGNDESAE